MSLDVGVGCIGHAWLMDVAGRLPPTVAFSHHPSQWTGPCGRCDVCCAFEPLGSQLPCPCHPSPLPTTDVPSFPLGLAYPAPDAYLPPRTGHTPHLPPGLAPTLVCHGWRTVPTYHYTYSIIPYFTWTLGQLRRGPDGRQFACSPLYHLTAGRCSLLWRANATVDDRSWSRA